HLGDAGLGDDAIDAYRPDAFLIEQAVSGFQDALPGFGSLWFLLHGRNIQTCLFLCKPQSKFFYFAWKRSDGFQLSFSSSFHNPLRALSDCGKPMPVP